MSMIETVSDIENSFLSRREITCNFQGLGGKLKRKEAVDMITKEFNLSDKTVIAINMKNQTGRPNVTGMFYVYDNEELAKKQVNPTIFERLERQAKKDAEAALLKKQKLKHLLKKQKLKHLLKKQKLKHLLKKQKLKHLLKRRRKNNACREKRSQRIQS